jgi:hypothetical protein
MIRHVLIFALALPANAAAQGVRFLPAHPDFAAGALADPREPRIGIGFLRSDLFADELLARPGEGPAERPEADTHGVVQLGLSRALFGGDRWTVGLQGGAISRFRLDTSDNDALSVDYLIAVPVELRFLGTQSRVRLIHRSAHLGDELVQNSSVHRLEFDHEEVDFLVARSFLGWLRAYGGGSLTLASSYDQDNGGFQFGVEAGWPVGGIWRVRGGVDWQRHSLSDWADQLNVVTGFEGAGAGSRIRVQARYHSGASHLGEFFLEREKAWGAELIFSF